MISKIIDERLIEQAKELIEQSTAITIVTHKGPDGDAMGASLAMMHFLRKIGKGPVRVIVPNVFPDFLNWMPGSSEVLVYEDKPDSCNEYIKTSDLTICLDLNELNRTGVVEEPVRASKAKKIIVDHHLYPGDFADVTISYPLMSSTCELVFRLICRMGYASEIDINIAECIYTGLMTDTGNFSYNSNNAELFLIVSELIRMGVDKDNIHRNVYDNYSYQRMRLMGYCLYKKMKLFPQYGTALITLNDDELQQFFYKPGDSEGIVNLPMSINGIYFSCLMREDKEHDEIKISMRSQGTFPANQVASDLFEGGGHLNAAGGKSHDTLDNAIQKFVEHLPNYFEKQKE